MQPLVIVPTYNEAANIAEVLGRIRRVSADLDILVVDGQSPDGTGRIAGELAAELGGVYVMRQPRKGGLGRVYLDGYRWALDHGYDVIVQMDADLSHDPDVIPELLEAVATGADYAVGSRYVPGGATVDWPWHRRLLSRWGNRYVSWLLRLPIVDATSGFRAVRSAVLDRVDLARVRANGYAFQVEMHYRMHQAGARGVELPITFVERSAGRSKMSARIITEALLLVTSWGVRDRLRRLLAARP